MWQLPETLREIEEAGDDTLVLELIETFQSDTGSRLERMKGALARQDAGGVKAESHSMRGSARQMGADALADSCQTVETGAPKMNWPELTDQIRQAEKRFAEVCAAMSEYVEARRRTG
jgi:histidine phosphotransfer protein HptB